MPSFKKIFKDKKAARLYIMGFWVSFLSFFLQIWAPKAFSFLLPDQMPITFSIGCSLLGFSLGVYLTILRSAFKNESFYFFLIPLLFLIPPALISFSVNLYALSFSTALIFIPFGAVLAIGFQKLNSYIFYIIDFLGAIAGLFAGIFLLPHILFETQFIALIILTSLLSFFLVEKPLLPRLFLPLKILNLFLIGAGILSLYLQLSQDRFNLIKLANNIDSPKLSRNGFLHLKYLNYKLLKSKWSHTKRVDVIKAEDGIRLYYDNYYFTDVYKAGEEPSPYYNFLSGFKEKNKVLSIGPGGGVELSLLWQAGAKSVQAIEINSAAVRLMSGFLASYSGHIYKKSNVILADARRYLNQTAETYDLITLIDTGYESAITSKQILKKDFLRTREGLKSLLDHLTEDGIFLYHSRLYSHQFSIFNMIAALSSVLKPMAKSLEKHIAILRIENPEEDPRGLMIVKKTPLTRKDFEQIENLVKKRRPLWSITFLNKRQSLKRLIPIDETESLIKKFILSQDKERMKEKLYSDQIIHHKTPSDKKPFLNYAGEKSKLAKSSLLISAILFLAMILNLLFYLNFIKKARPNNQIRLLNYSIIISVFSGLFYGMTEVLFIELFSLSFHNQTLLMGAVLGSMLFGSVIAAFISQKLSAARAVQALAGLLFYLPLALWMGNQGLAFAPFANYLLVFAIMSGLAIGQSLIFPKAIFYSQREFPKMIPVIYGLNILAMSLGLFLVLLIYFFLGLAKAGFALYAVFLCFFFCALLWLKALKSLS